MKLCTKNVVRELQNPLLLVSRSYSGFPSAIDFQNAAHTVRSGSLLILNEHCMMKFV